MKAVDKLLRRFSIKVLNVSTRQLLAYIFTVICDFHTILVADSIKYVYSITLLTSKMITGTVCRHRGLCSFHFDSRPSKAKLQCSLHTVPVIMLLVNNVML